MINTIMYVSTIFYASYRNIFFREYFNVTYWQRTCVKRNLSYFPVEMNSLNENFRVTEQVDLINI